MAQAEDTKPTDDSTAVQPEADADVGPAQERANYVGAKPLNYKKWDELEDESDEDDCHPNIEIGTWRRLKERMRREKGIKKKEVYLVDKWNKTTTNENYSIDPVKAPTESETADPNTETTSETKSESVEDIDAKTETETETKIASPAKDTASPTKPAPSSPPKPSAAPSKPSESTTTADPTEDDKVSLYPDKAAKAVRPAPDTSEPYKARSNPQTFLDENLDKLRKFAGTKKDSKADRFLRKHPHLVHEASEGFLITHAVDRAVEGAQKPELARLARRCLSVHNLVQSCSQQNVAPKIGVERFFTKVGCDETLTKSYAAELQKQVKELLERIEVRRVERLAEMQDIPDDYGEEEKAPLGPGGLDPTEVLNSLPQEMQQAFVNQDVPALKRVLGEMEEGMAEYHMRRCIDAGLWVQPEDDEEDGGDGVEVVEEPKKAVKVDELD